MIKLLKNKKLLFLLVIVGVILLTGCARNIDEEGHTLPEKIIYLTTAWSEIWENDGLLTFLIVYPLAQCINFLSKFTNVGIAIALTAVLLHVILLPISIKSTVSSQKMQLLQPELQKIQRKYENRNDENARMQMAMEQQRLMEKYNVSPLSSLTMFLQLPIIICMYYAVQRADAVVNGTLFSLPLTTTPHQAITMGTTSGYALFVIFVLMIIVQFFSMQVPKWLADKKRKADHKIKSYDPANQADNTMKYMNYVMTVMIAFWGFNWPTAMSLYWLISSLINALKTIFIQRRYVDNEKA